MTPFRTATNFEVTNKDGEVRARSYFFRNHNVCEITWTPGKTNDVLEVSAQEIEDQWPALSELGFDRIDTILPIPSRYGCIEYQPGNKRLGEPKEICEGWPALAEADFHKIDEQSLASSGHQYCQVKWKETEGETELLLLDSGKKTQGDPTRAYAFSGPNFAIINLVDSQPRGATKPRRVAHNWKSLRVTENLQSHSIAYFHLAASLAYSTRTIFENPRAESKLSSAPGPKEDSTILMGMDSSTTFFVVTERALRLAFKIWVRVLSKYTSTQEAELQAAKGVRDERPSPPCDLSLHQQPARSMSSSDPNPEYHKLKAELATAREQISAALDRYAELCLEIRDTHHRASFKNTPTAGFSWSELASELPILPLLETKLQEASRNLNRAHDLGRARSSSDYSPLIDKLPDEILAQIFGLAVSNQPRDLYLTGEHNARAFPQHPDAIAHTCARWRKVALACSSLWTHIYLAPHPIHFDSILNRARSYAQLASDLLLELHITDIEGQTGPSLGSNKDELQQFLSSVAHRIKALEIFRGNTSISGTESEGFSSILRGCSETLTRFVVHSKGLPGPKFVDPRHRNEEDGSPGVSQVDPSREQMECDLAYLTVSHMSEGYPQWASTTYRGLVDLRLMSDHEHIHECPRIQQSEFMTILDANPHLRILHFGLNLADSDDDLPWNYTSVRLYDLEVLYLCASGCYGPENTEYEIQRIMRHITPGSKPLRLTLDRCFTSYNGPVISELQSLFLEYDIVKFCARRSIPPPVELLNCARDITELVFDHCRFDGSYSFYGRFHAVRPDLWIIRGSSIYIEDLHSLVDQYSALSTVLFNCRLFIKDAGPEEIPVAELDKWGSRLPDGIQYLDQDLPDPTANWDNLDQTEYW
ncbi:hypothetical protein FRC11_008475 [Ceratobasidium sp. 423]|nr:hypothetical protein FRC11_008475 [Ceratobasidium sp. 423]